jgi:hypothetical protein
MAIGVARRGATLTSLDPSTSTPRAWRRLARIGHGRLQLLSRTGEEVVLGSGASRSREMGSDCLDGAGRRSTQAELGETGAWTNCGCLRLILIE